MLLSTVIPVYNAAPYLAKSIGSIITQDLPDGEHEVLLVDDGSTDSSAGICDEYARRYPGLVRVIHKPNGGVASARNAGLKAAQGRYIHFMDSDDWIIPGSYNYVREHYLDGVKPDYLGFWSVTLDSVMRRKWKEESRLDGEVIYDGRGHDYYASGKFLPFSTIGWYRRSFLLDKQLEFREGMIISEDTLFNLNFAMANPVIRLTNSVLYRYEMRDGSAINQRSEAKMRKSVECYEILFSSVMNHRGTHAWFEDGADMLVSNQIVPFMSRVLSAGYSAAEFKALRSRLEAMSLLPVKVSGRMSRVVNHIFAHSSLFPVYTMLYRRVFVPYVLPRLSRN